MKILVVAVGQRMPDWVADACAEYLKRMPRELPVSLVEVKPEPRSGGKTREQLMAAEAARIRTAIPGAARLITLDERGDDPTSTAFAQRIEGWMQDGRNLVFIIGGADGLDPELKRETDGIMRLSSLTLPHGLARVLLCEQLYRASSLIRNHPYHRE